MKFWVYVVSNFYYLTTFDPMIPRKLLTLTFQETPRGTTMYWKWLPLFNLTHHTWLMFSIWVMLWMFPFKLKSLEAKIIVQVGKVLVTMTRRRTNIFVLHKIWRWSGWLLSPSWGHFNMFLTKIEYKKYPICCHFLIDLH